MSASNNSHTMKGQMIQAKSKGEMEKTKKKHSKQKYGKTPINKAFK